MPDIKGTVKITESPPFVKLLTTVVINALRPVGASVVPRTDVSFAPWVILPDNSNLEIIEKKYCSCLMKVRSKKNPIPYGICTDAVYKSRGLIRDKVVECTEYYDFNKYNLKMLKMFAKEKKIKGYSKLNKRELLIELKKYQEMKRMKLLNKNNKK